MIENCQDEQYDEKTIDELIERLENASQKPTSDSPRVMAAFNKRQQQLQELKKLQQEAKKRQKAALEEERELLLIDKDNDELSRAIEKVKALGVMKNQKSCYQSSSGYFDWSSESRDSGESRW